jgi:exosortase
LNVESLLATVIVGFGGFLLVIERFRTCRRKRVRVRNRWLTNIGLALVASLATAAVFPDSPFSIADSLDSGPVSALRSKQWVEVVFVFLFLDCWRYWEHRVSHHFPLLWRMHLVHHSDTDIDVTTAQRHHPFESLMNTLLLLVLLFALGFSATSLAVFVVAATVVSLVAHANVRLPEYLDSTLRWFLVTPAVHAVHHSSFQPETDSNYGTILTVWDRIFGTYVDPKDATIPHYGLEYFYRPEETNLWQVLLQPFRYHARLQDAHRSSLEAGGEAATAVELSDAWRDALLYGAMGLVLTLVAMWSVVADLAPLWRLEAYSYSWLVLPAVVYVLFSHSRDELLACVPRPGYGGVVTILIGLLIWGLAFALDINLGKQIAFVVLLQGIAITTLGWKVYSRFAPVFLMLFLMVPSGDLLQPVLRQLTVQCIDWFASVAAIPHSVDGYMVYIAGQRYIVVDGCSGLSNVTLGIFLAYYFGVLLYRSLIKILAIALVGGFLGIMANAVRVSSIVWIDYVNGSQLALSEHGYIAWLALLFAMGLLLIFVNKVKPEATRATGSVDAGNDDYSDRAAPLAPLVAGLALLTVVNVPTVFSAIDSESGPTRSLVRDTVERFPEAVRDLEETSSLRTLSLHLNDDLRVLIIETKGGESRLSADQLTPTDDKWWRDTNSQRVEDCSAEKCATYVRKTWNAREGQEIQNMVFAYYVGDLITGSKLHYRVTNGWNRVTGNNKQAGLISVFSRGAFRDGMQSIELIHRIRDGTAEPSGLATAIMISD